MTEYESDARNPKREYGDLNIVPMSGSDRKIDCVIAPSGSELPAIRVTPSNESQPKARAVVFDDLLRDEIEARPMQRSTVGTKLNRTNIGV